MEQHSAWRLRIIEYAWAHGMIDVFQDIEAFCWPEGEWGILSLDESWRVRVASAQVYSIIKSRRPHHYERVLAFLEHTHTLLPKLVPAIKHMKIVFGLKTMVIMWMLRRGIGPIDVIQKIIKYFPSKLPQYEDHCRKHEMYLMRRNQLDFRTFAESLVMDKQRLDDYIQNHVEEQYGEHYAQKTEERLLYYLRELDKALPQCTYIDKIMKKNFPVKEEEKALLDLITDDLITTATRLKTLLHSDAVSWYSLSKSHLGSCVCAATSKEQLKSAAEKSLELNCPVTDTSRVHINRPRTEHTLDETNKTICVSATEMDNIEEICLENSSNNVTPHFCSKHQRWVRNLLCECPMESSEGQPHEVSEISPSLFTSTSSSDLTLSDLPIPPEQHLSPSTSNQLQEEGENPKTVEKLVSEPVDLTPPLHSAPPPIESFIAGDSVVIVPCVNITPVTICPRKSSATSNDIQMCNNEDSMAAHSTVGNSAKTTTPQTATSSTPFISKVSKRLRLGQKYLQSQKFERNGGNKVHNFSQMNFVNTGSDASLSTHSTSGMDIMGNTQKYVEAQSSSTEHMTSSQDNMTFSNNNMKPCVVLKRMSIDECLRITKGRFQSVQCDDMGECIDPDIYIFDVNSLFSSSSSEEKTDSDTEYRPNPKTLRRWSRGLLPI